MYIRHHQRNSLLHKTRLNSFLKCGIILFFSKRNLRNSAFETEMKAIYTSKILQIYFKYDLVSWSFIINAVQVTALRKYKSFLFCQFLSLSYKNKPKKDIHKHKLRVRYSPWYRVEKLECNLKDYFLAKVLKASLLLSRADPHACGMYPIIVAVEISLRQWPLIYFILLMCSILDHRY